MTEDNKTAGQRLQEELGYNSESAWLKIQDNERDEAFGFCDKYKDYLNKIKTERDSVEWAESKAKENGFTLLSKIIAENKKLKPGDKIYSVNRNKNVIFAVIGDEPLENGLNIVGAHIDTPRIDLKPNPLYEENGLALLKTHYYGGIKKYQWTAIPLALHGVIFKSNGDKVKINIGEDDGDPQFCITDLLPHLAQEQMQKKMSEGVTGEGLNILFGSIPYNDEKLKEKIKTNILDILNKKYGIVERDFQRAELEVVPAFKAVDIGLDRSMIGGYGQDDRICAFTALEAFLKSSNQKRTIMCLLVDKEEIGSAGNTGIKSTYFENTIAELCALTTDNYTDITLRRALNNSKFLSADVTGAIDPTYGDVNDKKNATYLGKGVAIMKYTGSKGKYDASDANAEFVAEITNLLSNNNIIWQIGELGKVDLGGGGTIAQYIARYGTDALDVGPGILSMHAPFEISSKADIYMTYKAYLAFYST